MAHCLSIVPGQRKEKVLEMKIGVLRVLKTPIPTCLLFRCVIPVSLCGNGF